MSTETSDVYTWIITGPMLSKMKTAGNKQEFASGMFVGAGFRWKALVYPNGHNQATEGYFYLGIALQSLPPKLKQIDICDKFSIQELDAMSTNTAADSFTNCNPRVWPKNTLKTSDIMSCDKLTASIEMSLAGAYDKDDNDVTTQYINVANEERKQNVENEEQQLMKATLASIVMKVDEIMDKLRDMEQRVTDVELKINEEQKNDDGFKDKMLEEIKSMKQDIKKLSLNSEMDPEQQKLKSWLVEKVKLPQYFDTFINNGIEDLETASILTMEGLKAMGIEIVGHQMKILNQVGKLRQDDANEGGTAYV